VNLEAKKKKIGKATELQKALILIVVSNDFYTFNKRKMFIMIRRSFSSRKVEGNREEQSDSVQPCEHRARLLNIPAVTSNNYP
jgi:hypothetical protein